jgi:hypothetical protein
MLGTTVGDGDVGEQWERTQRELNSFKAGESRKVDGMVSLTNVTGLPSVDRGTEIADYRKIEPTFTSNSNLESEA